MNKKISNFQQIASVRRYTITSGTAKGVEIIDCDNGTIRFLLNVSKAMDIMQLYYQGTNISFLSKNAFTNSNCDFSHRFEGGMLYTCGLDNIGSHDGFEQHGTFHNSIAEITECKCDENGIIVDAIIKNTALFGEDLVVKRKITSLINSNEINLHDTLYNLSYRNEKYCLLYHVNLGYPFLDAGVKIIDDVISCAGETQWEKDNISLRNIITEPKNNQQEMCYYIKHKTPSVSVLNEKIKKKFTLKYSNNTLPCFLEWKSMTSGDYALGLEPCTCFIEKNLKYNVIESQQKIDFDLQFKIENY